VEEPGLFGGPGSSLFIAAVAACDLGHITGLWLDTWNPGMLGWIYENRTI